jgi:hypothetical protein
MKFGIYGHGHEGCGARGRYHISSLKGFYQSSVGTRGLYILPDEGSSTSIRNIDNDIPD